MHASVEPACGEASTPCAARRTKDVNEQTQRLLELFDSCDAQDRSELDFDKTGKCLKREYDLTVSEEAITTTPTGSLWTTQTRFRARGSSRSTNTSRPTPGARGEPVGSNSKLFEDRFTDGSLISLHTRFLDLSSSPSGLPRPHASVMRSTPVPLEDDFLFSTRLFNSTPHVL